MTERPEGFDHVCGLVNSIPLLQSMLYDLNLLPEQTAEDPRRWYYTVTAAMHMEKALASQDMEQRAGFVMVPVEAPRGLLVSMAIRADHALGCPGYYDQPFIKAVNRLGHAQMLEATMATMRQLHEEVVGTGFYKPEKEADYAALAAAPPIEALEGGKTDLGASGALGASHDNGAQA